MEMLTKQFFSMELQPEKPEEDAQTRTIYNQQQIQPSYDDNSGNQTKAT